MAEVKVTIFRDLLPLRFALSTYFRNGMTEHSMKHKFSGETCIYCGKAASESSDHVVGRNFFLVERRLISSGMDSSKTVD